MTYRIKLPPRPGILDIIGITFFLVLLRVKQTMAFDPGVGWHLKTGEWIWRHQAVPGQDPFLALSGARPWVCDQWLSDLLFWGLYSAGGWPLLHAVAIILAMSPWFVILSGQLNVIAQSRFAAAFSLTLAAFAGSIQWIIRPVLFSFLFFAITCRLVYGLSKKGGPGRGDFAVMALIFLLWANLHPAFILGFVVLLSAMLEQFISDLRGRSGYAATVRLAALGAVCALVTLINPYGADLYRSMTALADPYFSRLNAEWLSPDFGMAVFQPFALIIILLVMTGAQPSSGKWRPLDYMLVAGFLFMALVHRRIIPFFSIAAAIPLCKNIDRLALEYSAVQSRPYAWLLKAPPPSAAGHLNCLYLAVLWCLMLGATLLTGRLPLVQNETLDPSPLFPRAAIDHLVSQQRTGTVFSSPNNGGYLILRAWPALKPFIDDRNQLNGADRYREYFEMINAGPQWKTLLQKYSFDALILEPRFALSSLLRNDPGWKLELEDEDAILFRPVRRATQ